MAQADSTSIWPTKKFPFFYYLWMKYNINFSWPHLNNFLWNIFENISVKTFYCNGHKITEFGITDKNSSTAYIVLYKWIDTWFLDSNRRVGVWSLPWRWHILSIPLITGRGTSAETCGLDDVFPPDDLGSRPEALCWYICIYICMYILYMSSVIGRIYNGSVIQYWRSCTPSRSIGECAVPGLNATFCFLWFTNCVLLFDKNLILGCLWLLYLF